MAFAKVLTDVPDRLVAGESASWKWADSDFPASSSWVLTYTLVNSSAKISFSASADGDDHLVELAKTVTVDYAAGEYDWQAHVTNGTERYKVDEGVIEIVTDFAAADGSYDARSHVKKTLDAFRATLEGRATKTQLHQEHEGVQIQHIPHDKLVKLCATYEAKYRRELEAAGKATPRRIIKPRFSS